MLWNITILLYVFSTICGILLTPPMSNEYRSPVLVAQSGGGLQNWCAITSVSLRYVSID